MSSLPPELWANVFLQLTSERANPVPLQSVFNRTVQIFDSYTAGRVDLARCFRLSKTLLPLAQRAFYHTIPIEAQLRTSPMGENRNFQASSNVLIWNKVLRARPAMAQHVRKVVIVCLPVAIATKAKSKHKWNPAETLALLPRLRHLVVTSRALLLGGSPFASSFASTGGLLADFFGHARVAQLLGQVTALDLCWQSLARHRDANDLARIFTGATGLKHLDLAILDRDIAATPFQMQSVSFHLESLAWKLVDNRDLRYPSVFNSLTSASHESLKTLTLFDVYQTLPDLKPFINLETLSIETHQDRTGTAVTEPFVPSFSELIKLTRLSWKSYLPWSWTRMLLDAAPPSIVQLDLDLDSRGHCQQFDAFWPNWLAAKRCPSLQLVRLKVQGCGAGDVEAAEQAGRAHGVEVVAHPA